VTHLTISQSFQVINIIVLILYRFGYGGDFLGIGGTWNLNEEKSPDAEIIASGVIVGYLIYTAVQLFTYLFGTTKHKRELSDTIMNVVGVLLWLGVAGAALHYWHGYQPVHDFAAAASERMVSEHHRSVESGTLKISLFLPLRLQVGLIMGYLILLVAALYLADSVLAFVHYAKAENEKY
jgi:hypothetical protein